jgi:hypothetical protein
VASSLGAQAVELEDRIKLDLVGATPVWWWKKSKKATPMISALAHTLTAARADFI